MRLPGLFSRHPGGDISAHADGELAPGRREALEAHLAGCERCRTELNELLAVRTAIQGLPQPAAPRSFALTPAMAEREPRPVASRAVPSFVAMRVAGAGFAVVLAVVVMLDAGGIVDDAGGRSSGESSTALFGVANRDAETTVGPGTGELNSAPEVSGGDAAGGSAEAPPADGGSNAPEPGGIDGVDSGSPDGLEDVPDGDLPAADGGVGGVAGGGPAAAPVGGDVSPTPGVVPNSIRQEPADATTVPADAGSFGYDESANAPESADGTPATLTSEDDGVSPLLAVEIGLAAIAVLAIGGSFVMRRREEKD